jgi:hypothetical protein
MTTAQKNGLKYAALIVGTAMSVAFTAGWVRREIDGKEDRVAHDMDMRLQEQAIRDESNARLLQHVHDSAFASVILDRVNDIACAQNPTRRYCR